MFDRVIAELSEKQWQAQVVELARTLGFVHYHTFRSKRSPAGFPDLVLVRERVVYAELKTTRGRLTDLQRFWLRQLHAAGQEAYVLRPNDLETAAKVLAARHPLDTEGAAMFAAHRLLDQTRDEAKETQAA